MKLESQARTRTLFSPAWPRRRETLVFVAFLLLCLEVLVSSRVAGHAPGAAFQDRKTSKPYTGDLSVFDSPGRDERLRVNRIMDMLGIEPGKTVADIGAGSGWFTVRAAKRVGGTGKVYAVDINPEAIDHIKRRARREELDNITTVLSKADDPLLPANTIDSVLLLKTYHEVANPIVLLSTLRGSLRPGAKVGIIDRNGNSENHGVNREVVVREAARAGYQLMEESDFVKGDDMDYFLIFAAQYSKNPEGESSK